MFVRRAFLLVRVFPSQVPIQHQAHRHFLRRLSLKIKFQLAIEVLVNVSYCQHGRPRAGRIQRLPICTLPPTSESFPLSFISKPATCTDCDRETTCGPLIVTLSHSKGTRPHAQVPVSFQSPDCLLSQVPVATVTGRFTAAPTHNTGGLGLDLI
jgi:hypothetical protein